MEWKFIIKNMSDNKVIADNNNTYANEEEALQLANKYVKENNIKGYVICIYKRNELYSRYGA